MVKKSEPAGSARTMALAADLRGVMVGLKRRMREATPPHDFSWSQISALAFLEREEPLTVSDLARAEGVRPQSMGETVASLQSAGLVAGSPDPADGRRTLLSVTAAGRDLVRVRRAQREDWLCRTLAQKLSAQEQRDLANAVVLLKRLVESESRA